MPCVCVWRSDALFPAHAGAAPDQGRGICAPSLAVPGAADRGPDLGRRSGRLRPHRREGPADARRGLSGLVLEKVHSAAVALRVHLLPTVAVELGPREAVPRREIAPPATDLRGLGGLGLERGRERLPARCLGKLVLRRLERRLGLLLALPRLADRRVESGARGECVALGTIRGSWVGLVPW